MDWGGAVIKSTFDCGHECCYHRSEPGHLHLDTPAACTDCDKRHPLADIANDLIAQRAAAQLVQRDEPVDVVRAALLADVEPMFWTGRAFFVLDSLAAAGYEVVRKSIASDVLAWLADERRLYANEKWETEDAAAAHRACVVGAGPTTWHDWAGNYIKRAALFSLSTPQGRQALGKAIVTLIHVLETAVEEYGPMPAPGVPSGEIKMSGACPPDRMGVARRPVPPSAPPHPPQIRATPWHGASRARPAPTIRERVGLPPGLYPRAPTPLPAPFPVAEVRHEAPEAYPLGEVGRRTP